MPEVPEKESPITIRFEHQRPMPAGKNVLEYDLPEFKAPDGRLLAENICLKVRGPEKVCIIGDNEAGKTTLIRKIAEALLPRQDLSAFYMPQNYEETLPFDRTPTEYLAPSGKKAGLS